MTPTTRSLKGTDHATVLEAVRTLRAGGVIAAPTDTVYGLMAMYDDAVAVERIYQIKGRPAHRALPLLIGSAAELSVVAQHVPPHAWRLIDRFWPGPLTLVFERHRGIPAAVTGGLTTVGARVPNASPILEILESLGLPLASTSANISGNPEATTAAEVIELLPHGVDLVIAHDESVISGTASTVVDLTRQPPRVARRGSITIEQIQEALNMRVEIAGRSA